MLIRKRLKLKRHQHQRLMTKKLCSHAGCRSIVDHNNDGSSPRCEKHKKSRTPTRSTEERKSTYSHHYNDKGQNLYSLYRWKKLRKHKVTLNPFCEHCWLVGIAKPVDEVDHIHEIEDGGEFWDIDNLQSLCRSCHETKTRKVAAERKKATDRFGYFKRS